MCLLGDFNASSRTCDNGCGVLGPFGSGSPNDNTGRMCTYSGMHDLTVLGSCFRCLDVHRWSRYSNDGFTKEIDHILTRQRDRGLIKSYRTFWSAESPVNSDHVLLVAELSLTLLKPRKTPSLPRPDVARLVQDAKLQDLYNITVENKFASLGALPDDVEESWTSFSHVISSSAEEVIGPARRVRGSPPTPLPSYKKKPRPRFRTIQWSARSVQSHSQA